MSGRPKKTRKMFDPSASSPKSPRNKKSLTSEERKKRNLMNQINKLKSRNAMMRADIEQRNRMIEQIKQMIAQSQPIDDSQPIPRTILNEIDDVDFDMTFWGKNKNVTLGKKKRSGSRKVSRKVSGKKSVKPKKSLRKQRR